MERRGFIKVMVAGGCVTISSPTISGCSSDKSLPGRELSDHEQNDIRLKLISYAMLAPNSHNIQPWLIKITGDNQFELFVDQSRLLPQTDPLARQIHVSQGTFLEALKIAGAEFGYETQIDYFPEGIYSNQVIEDKPVARVMIVKNSAIQKDAFFSLLKIRQSNKRLYSDQRIPDDSAKQIEGIVRENGFSSVVTLSPELMGKLASMLGKSMVIETSAVSRNIETANIFRFSEEEAAKYRDGFTLANNGMTGFTRWMVETFFLGTRKEAYAVDSSFSKEGNKIALKQAESATGFGWLVSKNNTRLDQVKTGHHYMRINLLAAQQGIALHPMSQILEEYEDMQKLQREFKGLINIPEDQTVQMLFRLGYAKPHPQTKRRWLKDIFVS